MFGNRARIGLTALALSSAVLAASAFAKSSLKKLYRTDLDAAGALAIAVEALYDAADDDSATGGPDVVRQIFPTAVTVTADGAAEVAEADIAGVAADIVARRVERHAPLGRHDGEGDLR